MSNPASLSKSPRLSGSRATAYQTLIQKSRRNIADLVTKPTTWTFDPDGDYSRWPDGFFTIGNWTTSFFTGMALISWIETEDDEFIDRQWIRRREGLSGESNHYEEQPAVRFKHVPPLLPDNSVSQENPSAS